MSIPPDASGPVFTVMRPRRMGPLCAREISGNPSAEALKPAPAAWMNRLRLNVMVPPVRDRSMRRILGRVGLLQRLRAIEGVDFHAFAENAHHRGERTRVDVEELRSEHLRRQAHVGERWRIAVAEAPGLLFLRKVRLERLERRSRPVREPLVARRLVLAQLLLELPAGPRDHQPMPAP